MALLHYVRQFVSHQRVAPGCAGPVLAGGESDIAADGEGARAQPVGKIGAGGIGMNAHR